MSAVRTCIATKFPRSFRLFPHIVLALVTMCDMIGNRRRHPRPPRPQCLPHRTVRRELAKAAPDPIRRFTARQSKAIQHKEPGEHRLAGFVSETMAGFIGMRMQIAVLLDGRSPCISDM